ncbi:hypothetical protein CJ030_MR2G016356 [Morella rubra]|uniref:Uncharacterized protein n=1 Tax=Morella rubra TaxID=262757 RepID=A0A6A1WKU4_9ROSI|nr:hypothetical protein CJ030_MR2G016356 [Morella rubra]
MPVLPFSSAIFSMASGAQLSPFVAPSSHEKDELLFSGDPKFALHGEIMMLILLLVFASFLVFVLFFMYANAKRSHDHPKLAHPESLIFELPIEMKGHRTSF